MPCQAAGISGVLELALVLVLPEASFLPRYAALDEETGLLLSSQQPRTALPGFTQLAF